MQRIEEKDLFRSSDLSLAAIISMYYPVEALDKSDTRKIVFVFRREAGLDELVQAFWNKSLTVEPRAYFDAIKAIKSRIYELGN